ncbi:MAG: hypothetical protein ACK4NR_04990 [Micavibrio sp.]
MAKNLKNDWDIAVPLARKTCLTPMAAFRMVNMARRADGAVNEYHLRRANGLSLRR